MPYLEIFLLDGTMRCQSCKSRQNESTKPTPFRTLPPHLDQKRMRTTRHKMDRLLTHSTFSKLSLLTAIGWSSLGSLLTARFLHMHNSEPSSDFRCDVKDQNIKIDKDIIRGNCFDQYQKQNNQLGVPLYAFIMVNVWVIPVVSVIYSQCVKSIVGELERRHQHAERRGSCRLFLSYFCQLAVSCALRIIFIVFLQTGLFYPKTFPATFTCSLEDISGQLLHNETKSANAVHCFTQRAPDKNFWIETVKYANGLFALVAFLEILWIFSRARKGIKFMDNWQFYVDHLSSHADDLRPGQSDFENAIQTLKENCLQDTQHLSDLGQPFGRPNSGKGDSHDLTMDDFHVEIHEGTAHQDFAKDQDRRKQLKTYPPDEKDCQFVKPRDILDMEHKNVLAVGLPGIGKTSLSTKMLLLWASGKALNDFNVVFLLKFRRFNDSAELSLRELLARAETVQRLDDSVWESVQKESNKVLLIFDGLDEYFRKADISAQDDPMYEDNVEQKMPFPVLYKKLAARRLLSGASILTTTRPKAVEYVANVTFQRIVKICGFTSENVKHCVQRLSPDSLRAQEKIWEHIKCNTNLFSLCYIPVNCFLICHCLLQIFQSGSSQKLPTKITDIYLMIVKMIFFSHSRKGFSQKKLEGLKSKYTYKPFEKFPKEFQIIFSRLGEIAFKGIEDGRLLFESSEVKELEDCGLLQKLSDGRLNEPQKSQFCFTHLTLQEFFAAKHLVDTKKNEGIERFVSKQVNDGTWQVVLQFVAGLLKSSQSSDIFTKLLPKSTMEVVESSESATLTFWPATDKDRDLAVQLCKCLYEINDEQQPALKSKIEEINFNAVDFTYCSLAPIDVAAILHFLENAEELLCIDFKLNNMVDLSAKEVKNFIVKSERKLKWLHLLCNRFSDKAAEDLAEALEHSNCKLQLLDLRGNRFTDKAANEFAVALKHRNCTLQSLDLSHNDLTQEGSQYLTHAGRQSNCKVFAQVKLSQA